MNFLVVFQILSFLAEHKDDIKKMILALEDLVGMMAGPEKAAAIKASIATALGIEDKIEGAWPIVAPIFNLLVASVKNKTTVTAVSK